MMGLLLLLVAGILVSNQLFFRVNPGEQAVVLRFGRPQRLSNAGLHLRFPWPFEEVIVKSITQVNRIASDRLFMRRSDVGHVMLTGDENLVEVQFTVLWAIKDLKNYLFNARQPEATLSSLSESVVRDIVAQTPIASILAEGRSTINQQAHTDLQKLADEYGLGIRIQEVMMGRIDPPEDVIDAYRDVQRARADQERAINDAGAWAYDHVHGKRAVANEITTRAKAESARMAAHAEAKVAPFLAALSEYRLNPRVIRDQLVIDASESVLKGQSKVVLGSETAKSPMFIMPKETGGQAQETNGDTGSETPQAQLTAALSNMLTSKED